MRRIGRNVQSEITRKQINAIYSANKKGNVNVEPFAMKWMYDFAGYTTEAHSDSSAICEVIMREEGQIRDIVEAIFNNDFAKAQAVIDEVTEHQRSVIEGVKILKANEQARKERRKERKANGGVYTPRFSAQWQAERKHHDKNANYYDGI